MMKKISFCLILILLISCNSNNNQDKKQEAKKGDNIAKGADSSLVSTPDKIENKIDRSISYEDSIKILEIKKSDLMGIWTDGYSDNATFRIDDDSLLNVEYGEYFKYELRQDSFFLYYDDWTYKAKILKANKDTMIWRGPDYDETYTRFEN